MKSLVLHILLFMVFTAVVHTGYITYIRPEASALMEAAAAAGQTAPRSLVIILKDMEQEVCLILMLMCVTMILVKAWKIDGDLGAHDDQIMRDEIRESDSVDAAYATLKQSVFDHHPDNPLVRTVRSSIERFQVTRDVHTASEAIESSVDALAMRLESENSMIRYLIWAIPSIGFIGTVRGIGEALALADQALAGDISGMTDKLGVAFNSTLVALFISILLMFMLHTLQRLQDKLVVETRAYCEHNLLPLFSDRRPH